MNMKYKLNMDLKEINSGTIFKEILNRIIFVVLKYLM
jgi:hypothetical protein